MIIKICWGENGRGDWMEYKSDVLIKDMPITNFKKWAKLFAKYGTPQQHTDFLEEIRATHKEYFAVFNRLLAERKQWEDCARGLTFDGYTREFGSTKVKKVQSSINGVKTKLTVLGKKYTFLKGLLQ